MLSAASGTGEADNILYTHKMEYDFQPFTLIEVGGASLSPGRASLSQWHC